MERPAVVVLNGQPALAQKPGARREVRPREFTSQRTLQRNRYVFGVVPDKQVWSPEAGARGWPVVTAGSVQKTGSAPYKPNLLQTLRESIKPVRRDDADDRRRIALRE